MIKKHDADKGWHKNYFIILDPRLEVGGCFTTQNATGAFGSAIDAFFEYIQNLPNFKTAIKTASPPAISISYNLSDWRLS